MSKPANKPTANKPTANKPTANKPTASKARATSPRAGYFATVRIADPVVKPKTRTVQQIRAAVRAVYKAKRHEQT